MLYILTLTVTLLPSILPFEASCSGTVLLSKEWLFASREAAYFFSFLSSSLSLFFCFGEEVIFFNPLTLVL